MRAAIFDFDGVLVDSEPLHFAAMRAALVPEGFEITHRGVLHVLHRLRRLGGDPPGLRPARDRPRRPTVSPRRPDGSGPASRRSSRTCASFRAPASSCARWPRRCRVAIASGALHHEIEEILAAGGLRDAFTAIVGAEDAPRTKPDPAPYLEAARLLRPRRPRPPPAGLPRLRGFGGGRGRRARRRHEGGGGDHQLPGGEAPLGAPRVSFPGRREERPQALLAAELLSDRRCPRASWTRATSSASRSTGTSSGARAWPAACPGARRDGRVWARLITALLLQDGALPVVGYRQNRGRALALQQKLQDLYGGPVQIVEGDIGEAESAAATWTPRSTSRASSTASSLSSAIRRG